MWCIAYEVAIRGASARQWNSHCWMADSEPNSGGKKPANFMRVDSRSIQCTVVPVHVCVMSMWQVHLWPSPRRGPNWVLIWLEWALLSSTKFWFFFSFDCTKTFCSCMSLQSQGLPCLKKYIPWSRWFEVVQLGKRFLNPRPGYRPDTPMLQ